MDAAAGEATAMIKATACEAARGAIAGEGAGIGEWGVLGSVVAGVAARGIVMRWSEKAREH